MDCQQREKRVTQGTSGCRAKPNLNSEQTQISLINHLKGTVRSKLKD